MHQPLEILKRYWGYEAFRPLQDEIVQSVLDGRDTLALLPTGGGKSVCFQVPALCLDGVCMVISPLIALMKDQVEQLKKRSIKAEAIYSGMTKREIDVALDNCIYGGIKFLYVSPERLKTELFLERAKKMNVCLLAIDEAHCISQWGYDFRPPYLQIAQFKDEIAVDRVIALTATATKEVKADIVDKLGMKEPSVFQKSFSRENLSYSAFELEQKHQKMIEILLRVSGSSVVYVRSRKRTKDYADFLNRNGVSAGFYHAGLSANERSSRQEAWIDNQIRVMVATNAFGMGIDKPDVRTVIHMDLPDSLEAYYQEAGRAGRDGIKAYAVALFQEQDLLELKERAVMAVPTLQQLKRTYQALANFYQLAVGSESFTSYNFHFETFTKNYNLPPQETFVALKKLNDEGLIQLSDGFFEYAKVIFIQSKEDVYRFQVANAKLDPIVKALLRLHGGELFTSFMRIKERELASICKADVVQVVRWLKYLSDQGLIDYRPASEGQQIVFLTPRLDPEKLNIDEELLEWRRKLSVEKADAVISYMKTKDCRTAVFQMYFDEVPEKDCGICDNDLERKKVKNTVSPTVIMKSLHQKPASLVELVETLKADKDEILNELRLLMEDQKVIEKDGVFKWVS